LVFKGCLISHDISEDEATKLIEDRMEFKLYVADQHLNNLKRLEQKCSNIRLFKERILWEMEIEPFMFHVVGARDSLLVRINDKLGLKLKKEEVNVESIRTKLVQVNEQNLLTDFDSLNHDDCFRTIKKLRNQSTHRG
jgi:hypothetical protein